MSPIASSRKIASALISVYDKKGLEPIVQKLQLLGVKIFSTGGTRDFIEALGIKTTAVEELTSFPEVLGGRVKTLHPKVFGGILSRRDHLSDVNELEQHGIETIDLVMVDLYPFEETLNSGASHSEVIEKIDIGGISLIRAGAKNFNDVVIVPSKKEYSFLLDMLNSKNGSSDLSDRKYLAGKAFKVSSFYDQAIAEYFEEDKVILRYGENPHQSGTYFGKLDDLFDKLNGKELSYNNLLDLDAALHLIQEFDEPTFLIIKHNNPCGAASSDRLLNAWRLALAADAKSAFGGVLVCNREVDLELAHEINKIFFEVLAAPGITADALELLKQKKNRILLHCLTFIPQKKITRTLLNGRIEQDRDLVSAEDAGINVVTKAKPSESQMEDLLFAEKIAKHAKSNTIVLVKNKNILGIGAGLTSRVDALMHAIAKAKEANLNLDDSAMASDAFFPFPDCVQIAKETGVNAVIQPGGSVKDADSIDYCDKEGMAMVFTGIRHFKH